PLRLEYTAEITPGSLPCDVSFVWCEQVGLDEEPERYEYRGGGRSINLQFAGHDNTANLITDAGHRLPVAYTDEALPVGRPLRLEYTAEITPGSLPCDVSFVWCEQVGLDEEPERYEYRGGGRSINLQFAGHDNTANLITDAGHRLPVAYTDEALPVGRPLR